MRVFWQLMCFFLVGCLGTAICHAEQPLCDRWLAQQAQDVNAHAHPCMQRFFDAYYVTKKQQTQGHDPLYHLPIIRALEASRLLA